MARTKRKERDPFEEAVRLLERAKTARERLRALEAIRAAVALELRDFTRARTATRRPSEAQLKRLEQNHLDAWREFEAQRDKGLDHALRALAGVREALAQLRSATAGQEDDTIEVAFEAEGEEIATWRVPRERAFSDVPDKYRGDEYSKEVQLHFNSGADTYVRDRKGKLVWSKHGEPAPGPRRRLALPHEDPPEKGNGGPQR